MFNHEGGFYDAVSIAMNGEKITVATVNVIVTALCIGCGQSAPPSPYAKSTPAPNILELPTITATADRFVASPVIQASSVKSGNRIDVVVTFTGTEAGHIPGVLVLYWNHGNARGRPSVQQAGSTVVREAMKGTATFETEAPSVPGKYEIEIRHRDQDSDRSVVFPIVVTP